jgi:hypothetical protein
MDWHGVVRRSGVAIAAAASLCAAGAANAAASVRIYHQAPTIVSGGPMSRLGITNDVVTSTNWSGYAVESGSQFTDVKGTWVEPKLTCFSFGARYSSFWAGIDGYASQSVEQLGTDADCNGFLRPSYYAWYEMYPAGSVSISTTQYPVKPGDTLTGEVTVSGSTYTLSLQSSRGWTFTTSQTGSGLADSSAELIAESPEICSLIFCSTAQLPNFGTVPFTGVQAATGAADSGFDAFTTNGGPHEIVGQTSSGVTRVQPTSLTSGAGGDAFSVTWHHA